MVFFIGDSWQSKVFSWEQRLSLFLQTVSQRPDLAASVRYIYIHPELVHRTSPEEVLRALDNAARLPDGDLNVAQYTAHFQAMLKEAGYYQWELDPGALLGLLLTFVPNLQRLNLQVTEPTAGVLAPAFQTLARATAPAKGPLEAPDAGHLQPFGREYTFQPRHHVTGILEAAKHSLETIKLHMCGAASQHMGKDTLHLRHLRITQSRLSDVSFYMLMSACAPSLETFFYETSYPYTHFWNCVFNPAEIHIDRRQSVGRLLHHLAKFKATLKSLHLDLRSRQASLATWEGGNIKPLSSTETLREFNALQHVFISTCCLGGVQEAEMMDAELLTR